MANLTAKFKLIDEMSAKLDKIAQSGRNALSQWEQAGNAIDGAFDGAVTSTVQVAQSIDDSSDSIEELTSAATRAATAVDEMETATEDAVNAVDKLTEANDETEAALEDVVKDADKASEKVKDYGEESEDAGRKSEEFGKKSSDALRDIEELLVGAGIVRGLQAIGEAFVGCIEDAIEFESAITGVYKTVDGTPEQLAAISEEVKEMSLRLPSTTTEIAAVAEAAGQLGIQTDNITSFTEVMINLGEATNLTSDEAASSLAKFANITKMSADQYENLGSTVVALGNNFATTEADIVAMSTRMASAGSLAGLSEPEILALAAAISSVGIEADAGGSSMSTLLSKLQLAVETGNDQLEQFASVAGMTADEFSQKWGENAVDALYAFIAGLNDTERNGASATALLDEMGITEIRLSNAVKALASNHEGLANAVDLANGAWEQNTALSKEAETRYSTLESKLAMVENAQTNLSTAIGEVYAPTVASAAEIWGNMLNGITGFVKAHPTAVKAIVAITAGVAAFVVGIVAYTAAVKVAKVATTALTAAMATNPYLLLGAAIAGVVVGITAFAVSVANSVDPMEELTATAKQQERELQNLEAQYEDACEKYGETSEEASRLRYQMDDLADSIENNGQTLGEWCDEMDAATQSHRDMMDQFAETNQELRESELADLALIQKLEDLATQTVQTGETQEAMKAILDQLNASIDGVSVSYEDLKNNAGGTIETLRAAAAAQAEQERRNALLDEYVKLTGAEATEKAKLAEANAQLEATQTEYNAVLEDYLDACEWYGSFEMGGFALFFSQEQKAMTAAEKSLKAVKEAQSEAQSAYDETTARLAEIEEEWMGITGAVEDAENQSVTYHDAVNSSLASVRTEVEELCAAYDEAYLAARESIDGQIGLFQEMVVEAEMSIEEMQGAWESQINYLTTYSENIKKAMDFGLDESLVEELSDGSEESAAHLDTIISKVEALGGTTEEAKKFVDDFNKKFQEVETAKDEFAGQVADMETDFTEKMQALEDQLNTSIDNMNMEADAAAAAKATMSAYIQEIIDGGNSAVAAAADAAARVAAALANTPQYKYDTSGSMTASEALADGMSYATAKERGLADGYTAGEWSARRNKNKPAYASGTAYAMQGPALVGENGPEIIEFGGGETVYPADETSRILARIGDAKFHTSPEAGATAKETPTRDGKEDSKTIRLEINGSGAIEVDGSMDEETVVGILYNHLKPVLTNIVKQEIYEEGELAYDF